MLALVVKRASSSLPRAAHVTLRRGFASEGVASATSSGGVGARAAGEVGAATTEAAAATAGKGAGGASGGGGGGIDIGGAFRTVFSVALAGITAGVVENTLNDLVLWSICKSHAMPVIDAHPRLQRSLVGEL